MKCFQIFSSATNRRDHTNSSAPDPISSITHNLRNFSFSELKKATNNFNESSKMANGPLGSVYRGSIKPLGGRGARLLVAITRPYSQFTHEHEEWLAKVEFLGVVEHPNVVKLLGYCLVLVGKKEKERILVYEYMPNKSLESRLFSTRLPPIPWINRLQILLGVAQGLATINEVSYPKVIFCDLNSAYVLLDENFNPKLSDIWLERGLRDLSITCNLSHYARDYVAPEHVIFQHSKTDSWSFGVLLYEILSGRKARDISLPQSEQMLIEWVKQFPGDSKMFHMIMDPRLNKQYSLRAARKVAKLAGRCLQNNWKDRPTISEIVDVLQDAIKESEDKIRSPLPETSTRKMVHAS